MGNGRLLEMSSPAQSVPHPCLTKRLGYQPHAPPPSAAPLDVATSQISNGEVLPSERVALATPPEGSDGRHACGERQRSGGGFCSFADVQLSGMTG